MNAIEVKPRKFNNEDARTEATFLGTCIAGYLHSARKAREKFTSPSQAVMLAETLSNLAEIWFGNLVTIEEKEA